MSIYEKLSNIQRELIAPKGQRNDFGKYNYRSCEDIMQALKPLCDKNKCVVYITNDLESINDRIYVKAIVTLADCESDATITSIAHAREEDTKKGMDGSQITGASSSYARKYALAGLFMIDNEKDSDATNDGKPEKTEVKGKVLTITPEQKLEILKEMNRIGDKFPRENFLGYYKVKSIDDIPADKFSDVMNNLAKYK